MKSVVFWSVALPALLAGSPALAGQDSPNYQPYGAEYAPTAPYDDGAYNWDDRVYSQQNPQTGVYDGTWTGNYVDNDGRIYEGEWNGTYIDENGQAYEGNYRGTSIGAPRYGYDTSGAQTAPYGAGYAQSGYGQPRYGQPGYAQTIPAQPVYGDPAYRERRDNRDDGVGGAIIGGVAGGVAGNLIGGRGNRLAGTLIGGGVGAVAGYAIDRAEDNNRNVPRGYTDGRAYPQRGMRRYPARGPAPRRGYAPPAQHYQGGYPAPVGYGWQGQRTGYSAPPAYYYQPQGYTGGTTTVVVVPGQTTSTTTTTVTEEQYVTGGRARHGKRLIRKAGCNC